MSARPFRRPFSLSSTLLTAKLPSVRLDFDECKYRPPPPVRPPIISTAFFIAHSVRAVIHATLDGRGGVCSAHVEFTRSARFVFFFLHSTARDCRNKRNVFGCRPEVEFDATGPPSVRDRSSYSCSGNVVRVTPVRFDVCGEPALNPIHKRVAVKTKAIFRR